MSMHDELTTSERATLVQRSAERLVRLIGLAAPALIIERERLICIRRLEEMAPADAALTEQAKESLKESGEAWEPGK